jgi:hypothetical protein
MSAITGENMKHGQPAVYGLIETKGAPLNNDETVYRANGIAELSSRRESAPPAKVWNQMIDCEARNALQVILSGSEILLDNAWRISSLDQKAMLERILASAHHLNSILATLTRPDELIGDIFVESAEPEELHLRVSKAF